MSVDLETSVLDRILEPVGRCLTPAVATKLAELRADPAAQARIDELAEKSTAGALTPDERAEYETYVRAIDFVSALQAKARSFLASQRGG